VINAINPSPMRFCLTVVRPSSSMIVTAGVVVVAAVALCRTTPDGADQAAGLVLLYQMFAASTGYRDRAIRGHFDSLLALTRDRHALACAHFLSSVFPGAALWLVVGAIGFVVAGGHPKPAALSLPGVAALAITSAAAWCVSLPFGRYTGGACWTLAWLSLASMHRLQSLRDVLLSPGGNWTSIAARGGAASVCPLFLLAGPPVELAVLVFVTVLAAGIVLAGIGIVDGMDVPLEDPR
jgi:hypothetical protein